MQAAQKHGLSLQSPQHGPFKCFPKVLSNRESFPLLYNHNRQTLRSSRIEDSLLCGREPWQVPFVPYLLGHTHCPEHG